MINLLPPDVKKNISYARKNTTLIKWAVVLLLSIVGVVIIVTLGLLYMRQQTNIYNAELNKTKNELQAKKVDETQKQVQDISNSIKLVTQVLSREILFSKLIKQIGAAIPAKASLTNLQIAKVEGGIDLTAIATDYGTATQVQVNLQDPANKIFEKADILSVNCSSTSSKTATNYPCAIEIRALFAKNNPFLFINLSKSN